jgi:hypothetical protein
MSFGALQESDMGFTLATTHELDHAPFAEQARAKPASAPLRKSEATIAASPGQGGRIRA